MNNNLFNPPAIVRNADVRSELAPKIRATYRRTLEDRLQLGLWLIECKEATLRAGESWLEWLERETGIPHATATRWMEAANPRQAESVISHVRNAAPVESETPDAADAEEEQPAPHVTNNSGEQEWYTPGIYIDAARRVLGAIDLDPASNEIAQQTVQAGAYYTKEDNRLAQRWAGQVWMNPPYSSGLVGDFIAKLCEHFGSGDVTAAIVLVNNATETRWFQQGMAAASAICFPQGRIRFVGPNGVQDTPLQGQAFLYFGSDVAAFAGVFNAFGPCLPVPDAA